MYYNALQIGEYVSTSVFQKLKDEASKLYDAKLNQISDMSLDEINNEIGKYRSGR